MAKIKGLQYRAQSNITEYPDAAKLSVTGGATGTESCPLTHPIVSINPAAAAITAFNLADGEPGQMIKIVTATSGNDVDIIPATSTMFASIALDVIGDFALLVFVDSTVGWDIVSLGSVAVDSSPAYAVA